MSKINLLDSTIFNRISAGEVVERPASVVKELVENSIDANSTSITIEIERGGTKLIKVTDNGSGILLEDLKKAFMPHATSKISKLDDLDNISTLGFRGEALASIAAVSQIEMISKTKENETGSKIVVEGGKIGQSSIFGCPDGTTIIVKNLFFNTPARLKFLKSERQEESAITNIVNRLILSNPNINFKYIVDKNIVYNSVLKGLKEKIFVVYGKQTAENLIEIDYKTDDFGLSGYISLPSFCKANKTYQTIIVNNRYVSNSLISVAVKNSYENFLMRGKFPFFVLNLKLNISDIDVNIHPAKMEVKFKDTKAIYNLVYSTVFQALTKNNCPVDFNFDTNSKNTVVENQNLDNEKPKQLREIKNGFSFGDLQSFNNEINKLSVIAPSYKNADEDFAVLSASSELSQKMFETQNNINSQIFKPAQESFDTNLKYKIVGTVFNTYIIIESEKSLFILDQHAAHERLLFDKLLKQFEEKKVLSQELLLPYTFSVNNIEKNLIEDNLQVFKTLGFGIEPFGNLTYKISFVPSVLSEINLNDFIAETLKDVSKISSTHEQIKNFFASKACKAAVKGGQKLSEEEIKILLSQIILNKTILLCPHGRPICVRLSQNEIEKMFKRIV